MSRPCFVRKYDMYADETYQVEVTEDQAVEMGLAGYVVDNKPLSKWNGQPYPIRSSDIQERRRQQEAQLRERLRQPVEENLDP